MALADLKRAQVGNETNEHHSRLNEERALRAINQSPVSKKKLPGAGSSSMVGSPAGALRRERRPSRDSTASGGSRVSFREI